MRTCVWIMDNDEPCGEMCEGKTLHCASHNRQIRKEQVSAIRSAEKRKALLSKPKKIYKAPNKISDKRKEINKEYFTLVEQFKKDNPECKARINEHCTKTTDDPHHSRGRGKYLLDVSTWIPVCRSCHIYLESNPLDAMKRNLSFSRLEKRDTV